MDEPPLRGFRMTSARRRRERPWLWTVAALLALVVVTAVVVRLRREPPPPVRVARASAVLPATPAPTAAPSPTPTPELFELETEVFFEPPTAPTPTETAWIPDPPVTATPRPARAMPRPERLADCLVVTWTSGQASLRPAHVLIDIAATNRCSRDLAATDVWFRVTGWRQGQIVQTATGALFQTVHRSHTGHVGIGLPGSLDWYDRITLEVLESAP